MTNQFATQDNDINLFMHWITYSGIWDQLIISSPKNEYRYRYCDALWLMWKDSCLGNL